MFLLGKKDADVEAWLESNRDNEIKRANDLDEESKHDDYENNRKPKKFKSLYDELYDT